MSNKNKRKTKGTEVITSMAEVMSKDRWCEKDHFNKAASASAGETTLWVESKICRFQEVKFQYLVADLMHDHHG